MTGVVPFQLETVNESWNSFFIAALDKFGTVLGEMLVGVGVILNSAPTLATFACTFVVNVTGLFLKLASDRVSDASNEYPVYTFPSVVASLTPPEYIVSVVPGIDGEILHPISSYTIMLLRVRSLMDVGASG
jgi:hypothetical protein